MNIDVKTVIIDIDKTNKNLLEINKALEDENKKLNEIVCELKNSNNVLKDTVAKLTSDFHSYKKYSISRIIKLIKMVHENTNIELRFRYTQNKNYFKITKRYYKKNKRSMKRTGSIINKKETIIRKYKTYLIKENNTSFYKIGRSVDPSRREKTLQREKPNIKIVKIWDKNIEKILHHKYEKHRIRGEWFKLTPTQVKYICTNY